MHEWRQGIASLAPGIEMRIWDPICIRKSVDAAPSRILAFGSKAVTPQTIQNKSDLYQWPVSRVGGLLLCRRVVVIVYYVERGQREGE